MILLMTCLSWRWQILHCSLMTKTWQFICKFLLTRWKLDENVSGWFYSSCWFLLAVGKKRLVALPPVMGGLSDIQNVDGTFLPTVLVICQSKVKWISNAAPLCLRWDSSVVIDRWNAISRSKIIKRRIFRRRLDEKEQVVWHKLVCDWTGVTAQVERMTWWYRFHW